MYMYITIFLGGHCAQKAQCTIDPSYKSADGIGMEITQRCPPLRRCETTNTAKF
jgi:hypothetical protein